MLFLMFTWSDEDTLHSIAYGREGFAEQQGRPAAMWTRTMLPVYSLLIVLRIVP